MAAGYTRDITNLSFQSSLLCHSSASQKLLNLFAQLKNMGKHLTTVW